MKGERLDWLADNPRYTKRFACFVGRRCREPPIQEVAEELFLDGHPVKELDKQSRREQRRRAGNPAPRVLGIDELAIAKGHPYRIGVSDRGRGRPLWLGGKGRSEASLDEFSARLGPAKGGPLRRAVRDRGKAFRTSTRKEGNAPQATVLYDKFHALRPRGEAMDKVRQRAYARLSGEGRRFIQGQRSPLLSPWESRSLEGRKALRLRFRANRRLNKAYLLKESLDPLWDYGSPGGARRFLDNGRDAFRWQRWEPFPKFARRIEAPWDGIEAYCHAENQVALGFVGGITNPIRALPRRAGGFRDADYLRLKILTGMLPKR